jgi:molecular chaperone DnaK
MTIGVDFGTTNSVMAFLDGGEPRVIPNNRGHRLTPSVVAFTPDGEILVGESARNQAVSNPNGTFFAVKRDLGNDRRFGLPGRSITSVEVAAHIFRALRRDAESYLGVPVRDAVITVPANFDDPRRRAVIEAAECAGLRVDSLINEPTAAALAYASSLEEDCRILVYDLGGGTFDATFLEKQGQEYRVLASLGDKRLGGLDFDRALFRLLADGFGSESSIDPSKDARLSRQLMDLAEGAKIELSSSTRAHVGLPFLTTGTSSRHLSRMIVRREFEELIRGSLERSAEIARRTLAEGGGRPPDVLILSGGSSRIPLVRSLLQETFGLGPSARVNPEEVVALGAAIRTDRRSGRNRLRDVASLSLGVEIDHDRFVPIIARNTPVPSEKKKLFTTIADNQTVVEIHVLQGDHARASQNVSLGRFRLEGLEPRAKGDAVVEVSFRQDANGLLHVTARENSSGKSGTISVERAGSSTRESAPGGATDGGRGTSRIRVLSRQLLRGMQRLDGTLEPGFQREIRELQALALTASARDPEIEHRKLIIGLETALAELQSLELERRT